MATLRSSSVARDVCLRKQLLKKIFLKTWSPDNDHLDNYSVPEPSLAAACPLISPNPIREQPLISEINEQDVEMKNEDVLLENIVNIISPTGLTEKQAVFLDDENCRTSAANSIDLQDSLSLITTNEFEPTDAIETYVPELQKSPRLSKKMRKKYSNILDRIEGLERSVAIFCEKENVTPSDAAAFKSHNNISVFQNIKSSKQKKKYEKYFNKTLKVCYRLEGEINLYSQYVETLETAISSVPKGSKLSKMLEAKLKKALKFHEENPSHDELKTLMRQLKLVNLLIKKFQLESDH